MNDIIGAWLRWFFLKPTLFCYLELKHNMPFVATCYSCLPCISTVFEKLLKSRLTEFLEKNKTSIPQAIWIQTRFWHDTSNFACYPTVRTNNWQKKTWLQYFLRLEKGFRLCQPQNSTGQTLRCRHTRHGSRLNERLSHEQTTES